MNKRRNIEDAMNRIIISALIERNEILKKANDGNGLSKHEIDNLFDLLTALDTVNEYFKSINNGN